MIIYYIILLYLPQLNEIVAKQTNQTKQLDENLESYLGIHPRYYIYIYIYI